MARPLKYKTVKELQAAIDAYFQDCQGKPLLDEDGLSKSLREMAEELKSDG